MDLIILIFSTIIIIIYENLNYNKMEKKNNDTF